MRTAVLLSAFLLAVAFVPGAFSYTDLTVNNPQTGKRGVGTIEEAVVALTPIGAFMKYDVTMTFSARNQQVFAQTESLEVTYYFDLPADAVVNDLYLWVGNEVSRGLILDRATASATYEGIVKRRRDPAFLQKSYQNQYQLQIYPMAATGSRRVRFIYLVPLSRSADAWTAAVPRNLFTVSAAPLPTMRVVYYAPSASHVPVPTNDARYSFARWTDSLNNPNTWKCDVPNSVFSVSDVSITVPIQTSSNYLFTRFTDPLAGAYHVTLDPFAIFGITSSRKFLVAFDYDSVKTTLTRQMYIDAVKSMLRTSCTARDSFNIIFNSWQRSGDRWFAADSAGIAAAFKTAGPQTIPGTSDIPGLFMNIVDFLGTRGLPSSVILVAASDKLTAPAAADPVLSWLGSRFPKGLPVHVVNAMTRNFVYTYDYKPGGPYTYYYANSYFYDGLKQMTGGTVRTANEINLSGVLSSAISLSRSGLNSFEILVRFENGFTYSRYAYGTAPFQPLYQSQLAGQIGKYAGNGPVSVEISGFYEGRPYQKKIAVADSLVMAADSSLRTILVGKSIADIEWTNNSADAVKMITDACIAERVVCRYTALLALEPGDTIRFAKNNNTGPVVTGIGRTESAARTYEIASAYPNPFNPSTTLRVRLPEGVRAQNVTLAIYNLLGQKVRTFDASALHAAGSTEFRWDGTDEAGRRAASGMYLFVVSAPGVRHTVKLMLLK